jgi:hypothetical protein
MGKNHIVLGPHDIDRLQDARGLKDITRRSLGCMTSKCFLTSGMPRGVT